MHFALLGPLEVTDGERRVDLGAARQRAVLAVLLVRLNQVVSFDRLIDDLWGDEPPGAASASLQAYVSRLRRALEPDRPARAAAQVLVTEPPGYALRLDPDQVDAYRFERLAGEGRDRLASGDPHGARALLDEALSLWRGPALADFAFEPFATVAVSRLDELRVAAEEDRIEARLAAGDHAGAATALPPLIAEHPLRERLRGQLMVALYRGGRQAEALRAYEDARRLLADELGIDPGRELQALHRRLLEQDPGLDAVGPPKPVPPPAAPAVAAPPTDRVLAGTRSRPDNPLVGRGGALDVLERAWQGAAARHTRFVVIAGEPGIGKTTLAEELAARAEASGAQVAWGRCHDDEGALPLWPWAQVVRALTPTSEIPITAAPSLPRCCPSWASRRYPSTPTPPASASTTRSGTASSGPARIGPWSSSWTTCTGPTPRRSASCGSSWSRSTTPACWCSSPSGTPRPTPATCSPPPSATRPAHRGLSGSCSAASPSRTSPSWPG